MADSKDAADVTKTPAGLDIAVERPGTIVGSQDLQGTEGKERTDRPGEILGTPKASDESAKRMTEARDRELARADHVTAEVDRANREELPLLGGDAEDNWEPTDPKAAKRDADAFARKAAEANAARTTEAAKAKS